MARQTFEDDPLVAQYPQYHHHITSKYFSRTDKWAKYARSNLPTHGNDTNNVCESSFHTLKDKIMSRQKCYNCPDLLEHIMEKDSQHFQDGLVHFGNGRFLPHQLHKSRYKANLVNLTEAQVVKISDQLFLVESESDENVFYTLNMATGECECRVGSSRAPCKHKQAVTHYYGIAAFSALPTQDPGMRATWHYIATGETLPAHHYRGLVDEDIPAVEEFVLQQRARAAEVDVSNR